MNIINQSLETVPIDAVRPHPENPRRGDVAAITESIKHNGFIGSLIVQRSTRFILAGTHRWKAAQAVGLKEVPVMWVEVDNDHARRILLADNRTSDKAEYSENDLIELLKLVSEEDELDGTGWSEDNLNELIEKSEEVEAPKEPTRSKMGKNKNAKPPSFNVTVFCGNEDAQKNVLELLEGEGYEAQAHAN